MGEHDGEDGTAAGVGAGALLSFDAWVALSARLLKRTDAERAEILREHEIAPGDWKKHDDHFMRVLADDVIEGNGDLSIRYGDACVEELKLRKLEAKAPPEAPPAPPPPAAVEQDVPAPVVVQEAIPSYLHPAGGIGDPPPAVASPRAALAVTIDVPDFLARVAAAASPLPFGEQPSPAFLAGMDAPRTGPARGAVGETLPLGAKLPLPSKDTLPFADPPGAGTKPEAAPRLTLEAYASLTAELSVHPDRTRAVLERYNIAGEAARQAVDLEWQRRFSAHPDTHQRYRELFATYREWLQRSGA